MNRHNIAYALTLGIMIVALGIAYHERPVAAPEDAEPPPIVGDVSDFKDTEIVPDPNVPFSPVKNVIWCGTMALAWNAAISEQRGPIRFFHPAPGPEADLLNRQEFTSADLDGPSYVVVADTDDHHVSDQIRTELKKKFGDSFTARLLPDDSAQAPNKLDLYACLYKNLEFPTPFHQDAPFFFGSKQVAAFGFGLEPEENRAYSSDDEKVMSQVGVLSYASDDNFVLQLKLKNEQDQIILAKLPPGKTLQVTIDSVLSASQTDYSWIGNQDVLAIPKLNFDLTADFKQLEGPLASGDTINKVAEDLVFQLNQAGVKLTSFATISMTLAASSDGISHEPRHFIFDKPFLILLKRTSSPRPYFAMWVGNPTLLIAP